MKTVVNKKGNSGFLIQRWNHLDHGAYFDNKDSKTTIPFELSYIIRPVTIHSCGKKQMKLQNDDDLGSMRGRNFSPNTPIFETYDDAVQWVEQDFPKTILTTITRHEAMINTFQTEYYAKCKWVPETVERLHKIIQRIKDGELELKIFSSLEDGLNLNRY